ncbi:MAG: energy-coupling factor transporter ATPase [Firmicutes bacterium]|nr:energy-coupling factor transporter ATPase [Bacillota bacterium]
MTGEFAIVVKNLSYTYKANTPLASSALHDINLEISKGQFVAIIGQTGSGKSTFVQHLNGLIPTSAGHIWIDGEDIGAKGYNLKNLRHKVGLVFQYPEHQVFEETVFADIAFGPKNQGYSGAELERKVQRAMELVKLDFAEFKDRSPLELSGGQLRRVAIAGVLAMEPSIMILDEPTAGLDPQTRDEILEQIGRLHAETGITVLLVSHSMEDVARLADLVVVFNQGRIALEGSPRELFQHEAELTALGLGVPEVVRVMLGLKAKGVEVDTRVLSVPEAAEEIIRRWRKDA